MSRIEYICPATGDVLETTAAGLRRPDGSLYPFIGGRRPNQPVPSFLSACNHTELSKGTMPQYTAGNAEEFYDNFLNWLFATFEVRERDVRAKMVERLGLAAGANVIITACGLGDDVPCVVETIGPTGRVVAQDFSEQMVIGAERRLLEGTNRVSGASSWDNVEFFVGDATRLPFRDGLFDAALHFGGLNEFPDRRAAIAEMARVVRPGGRVGFGDEGVAPWLRDSDYGRMMINNIKLWGSEAPLEALPLGARNCNVTWLLGNCFYFIDFEVGFGAPTANIDVPHKGKRGGSIRTRYFGQIEGVDPKIKDKLQDAAATANMTINEWLESALKAKLAGE